MTQITRQQLVCHAEARTFRKRARIIAMQMHEPFGVNTDHGTMRGEPGDWLATNHPDDDPSSDIWPISAERFSRSYEPAE